ncbi:MAG: DUF2855 family protein [Rhizobiaceae bacterium]
MIGVGHVEVRRADIRKARLVASDPPAIGEGEILLAIETYALTTNNVTYAATGGQLGYWKFFPADDADWGIVPVWGFARVEQSNAPRIDTGERLYGFLPMASHAVLRPDRLREHGLTDAMPHRADLPAVYNDYQRVSRMADHDAALEDLQCLLQPLLATSWLLYDFLADNDWFGAEQIIIGSASSKTGLGLAKFLAEAKPDAPHIAGLTSPANRAFVEGLKACDQVVTYDAVAADIAKIPSVYVDMAGNATVRRALHEHLGDEMKHSSAVGTSHWDKFAPTGDLPGAKPVFFFAPAQIAKRREEWGPGVVQQKIGEAWRRIARSSGDWLAVEAAAGLDGAVQTWSDLAAGRQRPDIGHVLRM